MLTEPKAKARPHIRLTFELGNLAGQDWGYIFHSLEFKGMANGGYIVRVKLCDNHYNLLYKLIEEGYFVQARNKPVKIRFQILANAEGTYPESATRPQTAIILSLDVTGGPEDTGYLEFVAIDPPSWYLNMGDAAGSVWKGRVDQVIRQVVNKYAPGVNVEVSKTIDSEENRWWMMRQDPKTFIGSLLDWSSSITQRKTHWIIEVDGSNMWIREQAAIPSRQRAFYRYYGSEGIDTIHSVSLIANNALSVVQAKLLTQGAGTVSGQYLDRITDQGENKVFVKDVRTSSKKIAKVLKDDSFTGPPDAGPPQVGWTTVASIPEIYSAGDLGLRYDDYIDGRPRGMWLNMMNALISAKFTVLGHGEWSECRGLGVDTIFVKWKHARQPDDNNNLFWWMTGNWLVYGFHHRVDWGKWYTDLFCARFDWNAAADKVGGSSSGG